MTHSFRGAAVVGILAMLAAACSGSEGPTGPIGDPPEDTLPAVVTIPIVVHVVHTGELVGEGANLADERILAQIRSLNEDFRREAGSPGFNDDPLGADARIEFVLAGRAPDGSPTTGIRRIDASQIANPIPAHDLFPHYAHYGYWDPERYVNVWSMPLPEEVQDIVLGFATGPETDLPGAHLLLTGEPAQPEGILVNAAHFGPSSLPSPFNRGRTLTHEMGHYLGLLHLWGGGDCTDNDFVTDTPPVMSAVTSCAPVPGCGGAPTQAANYMTFVHDACMNLFTHGQVARMRHVLETSPRRMGLGSSPGLPE